MADSNWVRSALFLHRRSLPPASLATDHSCRMRNGEFGMRNKHQSNSFPIPHSAFRILRVSTNKHRAPLRGLSDARAFTSNRIGKDHPHDPDILILRQHCPTLAGFSGKWSLLDGRSAMATGWFPSLSDGVRGPSHPPGGCSVTRPPTCRVTRPRAWSQAPILNRFASSLAGG